MKRFSDRLRSLKALTKTNASVETPAPHATRLSSLTFLELRLYFNLHHSDACVIPHSVASHTHTNARKIKVWVILLSWFVRCENAELPHIHCTGSGKA